MTTKQSFKIYQLRAKHLKVKLKSQQERQFIQKNSKLEGWFIYFWMVRLNNTETQNIPIYKTEIPQTIMKYLHHL